MPRPRLRALALGTAAVAGAAAVAGSATLVATPALGDSQGNNSARTLTFYEISDGIILTDETPSKITITPGAPPTVTRLTNPAQGASGVGDEIIIDSALYAAVRPVDVPTLPPVLPVAADRSKVPLPWRTFVPAGPKVGDALGVCTFVRVDLTFDANGAVRTDEREASCELTFAVPGGEVVASGMLDVSALELGRPTTLAITGGTGSFQRARGTVTLQQPSIPAFDRFTVTIQLR